MGSSRPILGKLQPKFDEFWANLNPALVAAIERGGIRFVVPAIWHEGYQAGLAASKEGAATK